MKISAIIKYTKGEKIGIDIDENITDVVIDTRKIKHTEHTLFVALKGIRDGHDYINNAYNLGIRYFLVNEQYDNTAYADAIFIKVKNTLDALQQIAGAHRNLFNIPVIGITGSNGKTIVKEWLYQLLEPNYNITKSPKSYNSQIGVPLSLIRLKEQNSLGIFEAGISMPGEMQKSAQIIKPNIGVFTNIGLAHSEGFLNMRQKINEKLLLFKTADVLIYCKDYLELHETILQYHHQMRHAGNEPIQLFDWSRKTNAAVKIINEERVDKSTLITALYKDEQVQLSVPFQDKAYLENAINCWCTMLYMGFAQEIIQERMQSLTTIAMRLELKNAVNGSTLINDTYNSDLTSFHVAIDFLDQQKQHENKTIILSDIYQVGMPDADMYAEIAQLISERKIQQLIGIGPNICKHHHLFEPITNLNTAFYQNTEAFILDIKNFNFNKEAILLKGARSFKFELIEKILVQKLHSTVLEINLANLEHNLNYFRNLLPSSVKMMAMVKAYSYGSGSHEIANFLQYAGVEYLTVAYIDEGIDLRNTGITLPIMVMNPEIDSFDRMIAWNLEPEIYNFRSLQAFINSLKDAQIVEYPIHLKLDTGMHRLGFELTDMSELIELLVSNPCVKLKSIFSHLVGSDNACFDRFTAEQQELFNILTKQLIAAIGYKPMLHISNSAAIALHPVLQYDMVRLGIGLYGIASDTYTKEKLKPISTLKTHITQIRAAKAGESVGYSRKGILNRDSIIATVNIGYADGYFRDFGNGVGYMLIKGKPAKVIGVVCMDMCMLDITDIEDVKEGDEVIVFGGDLSINTLAEWADTIQIGRAHV